MPTLPSMSFPICLLIDKDDPCQRKRLLERVRLESHLLTDSSIEGFVQYAFRTVAGVSPLERIPSKKSLCSFESQTQSQNALGFLKQGNCGPPVSRLDGNNLRKLYKYYY